MILAGVISTVSYRGSKRVSETNLMGSDIAVLASHFVPQIPTEETCGKTEHIVSRIKPEVLA